MSTIYISLLMRWIVCVVGIVGIPRGVPTPLHDIAFALLFEYLHLLAKSAASVLRSKALVTSSSHRFLLIRVRGDVRIPVLDSICSVTPQKVSPCRRNERECFSGLMNSAAFVGKGL